MSFRESQLSACHLAPLATLPSDEVTFCAQCGAESPEIAQEITSYFVSKQLELTIRKWSDGDAKWPDVAKAIMDEVSEYKEATLTDLRLQMADNQLPAYIYSVEAGQWVQVSQ